MSKIWSKNYENRFKMYEIGFGVENVYVMTNRKRNELTS